MSDPSLAGLLVRAIDSRQEFFDADHRTAFRLFNGFTEGYPELAIDLYARTAVLYDYSPREKENRPVVDESIEALKQVMPWLQSILIKRRNGTPGEKRGRLAFGTNLDDQVCEHGISYSIDLRLNLDASLYLDTRNLRKWAAETLSGKDVLNTFAYTGSYGVAAMAGGASHLVQLDHNRIFLEIAKRSYQLNGFQIDPKDFMDEDFFPVVSRFKRAGLTFDCVFLDPPFFSLTPKGTVDLEGGSKRLINKVRPLVNDGGTLVAINNALFVSGKDYLATLETLCSDGYMEIERLIPVPQDFVGFPETRIADFPADPSPFSHPTKIALLRIKRKAES